MSKGIEIVIIEDNPNDAELIVRGLRKRNIHNRIEILEDGEEAIEFLIDKGNMRRFNDLRVIFLDLKLPKISGLELLKRIKTDESTKRIPVVVLTSSNQDSDIETAYNLGANSYVVKPVEFTAFSNTIENMGFYWLTINQKRVVK